MDIKQARKNVIEQQIRPWGGLNVRANQALEDIPRENFVPAEYQKLVFADIEIPLSSVDKMLSPKIEGRILDSLNLRGNEEVLEGGAAGVLVRLRREARQPLLEQVAAQRVKGGPRHV